jgi:hypothetical protein
MKRWSLDARSRRRKPQALCVGSEERTLEPRGLRRPSPGLMARLGVPVGGRVKKLRAVEDPSAPIPEEMTSELGRITFRKSRANVTCEAAQNFRQQGRREFGDRGGRVWACLVGFGPQEVWLWRQRRNDNWPFLQRSRKNWISLLGVRGRVRLRSCRIWSQRTNTIGLDRNTEGGFKFQVQRVNDGAIARRLPGA